MDVIDKKKLYRNSISKIYTAINQLLGIRLKLTNETIFSVCLGILEDMVRINTIKIKNIKIFERSDIERNCY